MCAKFLVTRNHIRFKRYSRANATWTPVRLAPCGLLTVSKALLKLLKLVDSTKRKKVFSTLDFEYIIQYLYVAEVARGDLGLFRVGEDGVLDSSHTVSILVLPCLYMRDSRANREYGAEAI